MIEKIQCVLKQLIMYIDLDKKYVMLEIFSQH